eukprot:4259244-Prymnesium_polylepis.1
MYRARALPRETHEPQLFRPFHCSATARLVQVWHVAWQLRSPKAVGRSRCAEAWSNVAPDTQPRARAAIRGIAALPRVIRANGQGACPMPGELHVRRAHHRCAQTGVPRLDVGTAHYRSHAGLARWAMHPASVPAWGLLAGRAYKVLAAHAAGTTAH